MVEERKVEIPFHRRAVDRAHAACALPIRETVPSRNQSELAGRSCARSLERERAHSAARRHHEGDDAPSFLAGVVGGRHFADDSPSARPGIEMI